MERLEQMNILMIGNNPIELSDVDRSVFNFSRGALKTTFLFDLTTLATSLKNLNPSGVFIDDKLNIKEIKRAIFRMHRNKNTAHIPVTIIKSSNFANYPNLGADDFILNSSMGGQSIYKSVINGKRFRKSRIYLKKAYRKQQGRFMEFVDILESVFYSF